MEALCILETIRFLGVGISFGISAKAAYPDKNVVVISGDGAFLSGGLSIESAFQEGLPIIVVIDNNGGLDCISQQQERLFANGQHYATDFRDYSFSHYVRRPWWIRRIGYN